MISKKTLAETSATTITTITVPIACTMQGTGTTHTATLLPNTYSGASGSEYENGIGRTTLTAICNDDNGFSIYATGFTGNQYEGENHTKLIGSNTGGTISTKAYTNGDTASNWSMKLIKVSDATESYNPQNLTITTGYDNWIAVPATYTKVAQYKANTGSSTTDLTLGVKLETTYAAYIASNQPADTYIGQVKYTMVHPYDDEPAQPRQATAGCINYFANASNAVGAMGCQPISASATTATLLPSNFSRTGYGFAGWSDKFDYSTNPDAHFYGPQESITFTAGQYNSPNNGLSLYAIWVKSAGSFQDSAKVSQLCGTGVGSITQSGPSITPTLANVSALTDNRDGQTYTIAKLADGKCWMVENLRLDDTVELTVSNTNNPLNDGTTVTLKHNYTDTDTYNTLSPTSDVAYNADTAPEGWCQTNTAECFDQSRLRTDNTSNRASSPTGSNSNLYNYGNYYNLYSATAGRVTYSINNQSAVGDICPSGWHLPKGSAQNDNNEYWALVVTGLTSGVNPERYGTAMPSYSGAEEAGPIDALLRKYPNNFLYTGYVDGSLYGRGSYGDYWTSSSDYVPRAFYFSLSSTKVNPGADSVYRGGRYDGRSVRCIATLSE